MLYILTSHPTTMTATTETSRPDVASPDLTYIAHARPAAPRATRPVRLGDRCATRGHATPRDAARSADAWVPQPGRPPESRPKSFGFWLDLPCRPGVRLRVVERVVRVVRRYRSAPFSAFEV